MRIDRLSAVTLVGLALAVAGCGGGSGKSSGSASTVAPSTSGTHPTPHPSSSPSPTPAPTPTPKPTPKPSPTPPPATGSTEVAVASVLLDQISVSDINTGGATTIAVGKQPTSVAIKGTYAYVANAVDQSVSVVDLLANQVTTTMDATAPGVTNLPLIGSTIDPILKNLVRPTGICVLPNGTKAFTANLINVTSYDLIAKKPLNSIMGLNINIANLITAITSGGGLGSFLSQPLIGLGQARCACTDQHVFVTNTVTHNVTLISATDDKVITNTDVGTLPIGVACAAGKGYVACAWSNEIWVLDEQTGAVKTSFTAPGQVPVDVAASPKGDKVYVANFLSGDITVIDTVTDLPVNTLPAGLSISQIFSTLGVPIPAAGSNGISGAISSFLSGFLGSSTGSTGSNTGLGGLLGGTGPIGPNQILSGLMSAFLSFAGINQTSLQGLNMPGIGVVNLSVSSDGSKVLGANLMFGLTITDLATQIVSGPQLLNGNGLGADGVGAGR